MTDTPTPPIGLEAGVAEATLAPVEVVIVDAGGDPVTEADTTPQWVTIVIVVLGAIVTALSTLLSVGAYAALREALKTFVKIGEILATFTTTTTDDEFIKRFKAALKLELDAADKAKAESLTETPSAFDPYAPKP